MTLVKVLPAPIVFSLLVLYIMVTSYTMISLVTGIISESLITSQQEYRMRKEKTMEDKKKEVAHDLRVFLYGLLEDDKDEYGNVKIEDIKGGIRGDTELLKNLAAINIRLDEPGVLSLVDTISAGGQSV